MAKVLKKDKKVYLELTDQEATQLNLSETFDYQVTRVKEGVWVLTSEKPKTNPIDAAIFSLLKQKDLTNRVEGKFESFLSEQQKQRFKQLLTEEKIIPFKLSTQYKHAVYKLPDEIKFTEPQKPQPTPAVNMPKSSTFDTKTTAMPNPSTILIDKEGFQIIMTEGDAKRFSQTNFKKFKDGKIKGLKSFDGKYYVIETPLLSKLSHRTTTLLKTKDFLSLGELSSQLQLPSLLVKTVCEFLKDEGEILEKKLEQYAFIK